MEIVLFNDLHLADRPPGLRKEGYYEEGMAMLCELVELARMNNACLVSTGDFFNLKDPRKNSLSMLGDVIDAIRPIRRIYVVPGNHDMNTRGGLEGQPLGLLAKAGVVLPLTRGGWRLNGVYVVSRPYNMARDTDPDYYALDSSDGPMQEPVLMVAHGSIIPPGAVRPYPCLTADQLNLAGVDILASGHIHEDLGFSPVRDEVEAPMFLNLGSLGRVSYNESNKTRTIKAAKIGLDEGRLTVLAHCLQTALPGDAIFNEPEAPDPRDETEIQRFVAGLSKGLQMEFVDMPTLVKSLRLDPLIEARVLRYLEEAE